MNANGIAVSYSGFPDPSSNVNILRNGSWIVNDSFDTPGTGTYDDTTAVAGVPYSYVIRSRPGGGVVNDVACSPETITIVDVAAGDDAEPEPGPEPPVTGEMSCSVSVNANGIAVSYSGFPDPSSNVNILRNGSWIATDSFDTPGTGTYDDTTAVAGVAYSYVIRSRPGGGVVNDVACSPATITF